MFSRCRLEPLKLQLFMANFISFFREQTAWLYKIQLKYYPPK